MYYYSMLNNAELVEKWQGFCLDMRKIPSESRVHSQEKAGCTESHLGQITPYDASTAISWII